MRLSLPSVNSLHPGPPVVDSSTLGTLRSVAPHAAPSADAEPTSGAGQSCLRSSHIRDAVRPLRSPSSSCVGGCQHTSARRGPRYYSAFRVRRGDQGSSQTLCLLSPHGHRRIRRITSKIAVDLTTDHAVPSSSLCSWAWVRSHCSCDAPVVSPPPL